jgi:hypothetical protein
METKIPFYNLVNMFLIGIVFVVFCSFILYGQLIDIVETYLYLLKFAKEFTMLFSLAAIGFIYMIGLIINRFSSVVIEKILILFRFIQNIEKDYKDFNNCRKENPFLYTLSREYNLSRVSFTLWLLLTILSISFCHCILAIISLGISAIFIFSMKKFSGKIHNIIIDFKKIKKNEK